jgi:hypothetical protein
MCSQELVSVSDLIGRRNRDTAAFSGGKASQFAQPRVVRPPFKFRHADMAGIPIFVPI